MTDQDERLVALAALMRAGGRAWANYVLAVRADGHAGGVDPRRVLSDELGLLSFDALSTAEGEITAWRAKRYRLISLSDPAYPANLRVVDARPPLLFIAGILLDGDSKSVAVIGTRTPTPSGRELAVAVASAVGDAGFVVVSGLAAGIDTEAHNAALAAGRRTIAVLGNGLDHVYPPENAELQRRIGQAGALVSQFWPESAPTRQSFPARNAVMSGLTRATVIIEAGERSGTRVQARHALSQGRRLILMPPVLERQWGRELANRPGAMVAGSPAEAVDLIRR